MWRVPAAASLATGVVYLGGDGVTLEEVCEDDESSDATHRHDEENAKAKNKHSSGTRCHLLSSAIKLLSQSVILSNTFFISNVIARFTICILLCGLHRDLLLITVKAVHQLVPVVTSSLSKKNLQD